MRHIVVVRLAALWLRVVETDAIGVVHLSYLDRIPKATWEGPT